MLGKLKTLTADGSQDAIIAKLRPQIETQLKRARDLGAEVLGDEARYAQQVIAPAWLAIQSQTGGLATLVPRLRERVTATLLLARERLFTLESGSVELVADYRERLPDVLREGMH